MLRPRRRAKAKAQPPQAITAAATRMNMLDPRAAIKQAGRRQEWQEDAWTFFDLMPEIKFTVWWAGNAISQVRLFAGTEAIADEDPVPVDAKDSGISPELAAAAIDEIRRLRSQIGGQAGIMRNASMNVDVAGECWLIGIGARDAQVDPRTRLVITAATAEDWIIKSIDEVVVNNAGTRVLDYPGDRGRMLDPVLDTAIRIWQPHPRWGQLADSGLRGCLADCEALLTFSSEQVAQSRSRHNAGVFLVPNGLSAGPRTAEPQATDEDDDTDPVTQALVEGWTTPVDDPNAEGAVAPSILRGDTDDLKEVRWVDTGRKAPGDLDDRIEKRIQRLARGLSAPVEVVMGHQQTTFANAAQVDEDQFDDFHRPRLVLLCEALTSGYLWPNLTARGFQLEDIMRVVIWFDPSELIADRDLSEAADKGIEHGTISEDAWRRYRGFRDDDAPTPEEIVARAGLTKGKFTGDVTVALLRLIMPLLEIVPGAAGDQPGDVAPPPAEAPPAASVEAVTHALALAIAGRTKGITDSRRDEYVDLLCRMPIDSLVMLATRRPAVPALEAQSVTAAARRGARTDMGRQLMDIDRNLRARLLTLADTQMTAVLERAGNRIKGRAGTMRDLTAGVEPRMRAAHVGPRLLASAGITDDDLLAGAFDAMRDQFMTWGTAAQHDALEAVAKVVGGLTLEQRDTLGLRQAGDLDEAWGWLQSTLSTLAQARLYDPSPVAATLGEVVDSSVPPGLIREAIARAGGAAGLSTTPSGGAYVTMTDAGMRPAGGIGTGDLLRDVLRSEGATVDAYRWAYGPAHRTNGFEPHAELDGVEFGNFDDDQLANDDSFPETDYYLPGDHAGCECDYEPIILSPADAGLSTDDQPDQ